MLAFLIFHDLGTGAMLYIAAFYKELALTSFDPGLPRTIGVRTGLVHYSLMAMLSFLVVTSLESVGILVVALLVLPGSTAQFFTRRLWKLHLFAVLLSATAILSGFHLAAWWKCPTAAAIAICGGGQFLLAWIASAAPASLRRIRPGILNETSQPTPQRKKLRQTVHFFLNKLAGCASYGP